MCRFVAILIFQGVIEDLSLFNKKEQAAEWLSKQIQEYDENDFADSMIWDIENHAPIDLGFAH